MVILLTGYFVAKIFLFSDSVDQYLSRSIPTGRLLGRF